MQNFKYWCYKNPLLVQALTFRAYFMKKCLLILDLSSFWMEMAVGAVTYPVNKWDGHYTHSIIQRFSNKSFICIICSQYLAKKWNCKFITKPDRSICLLVIFFLVMKVTCSACCNHWPSRFCRISYDNWLPFSNDVQ